jgi:hypothetical protein
MVLIFSGISLIALAAMVAWSSQTARLTERNNQYFATLAAAEAATEKVLAHLAADYQEQGAVLVVANADQYRTLIPTAAECPEWSHYRFSDAEGGEDRTHVEKLTDFTYTNLVSQYQGLYGIASLYRIVSNARRIMAPFEVVAGVKQEVQLATIPVFQFAIFYSVELEINPGPIMTVNGRVHCNTNIYVRPNNTLTFKSDVTATGQIIRQRHPNDPQANGTGTATFQGAHDSRVSSLTLPIGTNNTPAAVYSVIDVPPADEAPGSAMGRERYYNKVDLVVLVSNSTVTVTSGAWNGFATPVPWAQASSFLNTNVSFFNKRENKTIQATELDVAKLISWSATNTVLRPLLGGRDVASLYVADQRTQSASTQSGVRVVNGQNLPSLGLTVATKNPLYVKGHFNAPSAHLGTTNTSQAKPASLVGDAITVLSTAWNDANSTKALSSRAAASTTVNAALLAGVVPTGVYSGSKQYSGGVENFPRFLEDWSGDTLTYNGSMVVMFYSQIAKGLWQGTGSSVGIYNPPTRNWAFDLNLLNSAKLPPGTPAVRALVRAGWDTARAGEVDN